MLSSLAGLLVLLQRPRGIRNLPIKLRPLERTWFTWLRKLQILNKSSSKDALTAKSSRNPESTFGIDGEDRFLPSGARSDDLPDPVGNHCGQRMILEECRRFYADEIRFAANLCSKPLIDAFASVPREHFLGTPPWTISSGNPASPSTLSVETSNPEHLYHNVLVSIDPARNLNNGLPSALAQWIEALDIRPGTRVFHVGCGVGYYTAIMAEVAGPQARLVAAEIDPDLASRAAENLRNYPNIQVHSGDGAAIDPGPCDALFMNAGVTHPAPLWLERLSESGRIVLPLTTPIAPHLGRGVMVKLSQEGGCWSAQIVTPVAIYSSSSLRDPALDPLINEAFESKALFGLKSLRLDAHERTTSCIVHGSKICWSAAPL